MESHNKQEKAWHQDTAWNRKLQYWLDLLEMAKANVTELTTKSYASTTEKDLISIRSFVWEIQNSLDETRRRKNYETRKDEVPEPQPMLEGEEP